VHKLRSFLLAGTVLLFCGPVRAHGVLIGLPKTSHFGFTNRLAGLSGSASAYASQTKLITSAGINLGVSQQIQRAVINSGQLNGTLYQSFGGSTTTFESFPNIAFGFGSNPLSKMGMGTAMVPSTLTNSLSPISFRAKAHGGTPGLGVTAHFSAAQNQLHSLAENSVAAGHTLGTQILSSPAVGGNLYGTDYFQTTTSAPFMYHLNATYDYAFGNNPLNTNTSGTFTINPASLGNYVLLANGARLNFGGDRIVATVYENGSPSGGGIFTFGKAPFNFFNNFGNAPPTISFSKYPDSIFHISSFVLPHHLY